MPFSEPGVVLAEVHHSLQEERTQQLVKFAHLSQTCTESDASLRFIRGYRTGRRLAHTGVTPRVRMLCYEDTSPGQSRGTGSLVTPLGQPIQLQCDT